MLNCLIKRNHNLAVVFLDETTSDDEVLLAELENIDGETKKYDIDFVKVRQRTVIITKYMMTLLSWRTTRRQRTMGSLCCRLSSTLRIGFPPSMTTISQRSEVNIAMFRGKIIIILCNIIVSLVAFSEMDANP